MKEDDIKNLFDKIAHHFEGADEGAKGMFAMLVSTSLKYRDTLEHSTGKPLTVEEARLALDAFMQVLGTHEVPENIDKRVHDLVIIWLTELKEKKQN